MTTDTWNGLLRTPSSYESVKKFCATTQFDSSKAMSSGFVPPFTLSEGLSRTLELALPTSFSLGKAQASLAFRSLVRRFEFVHPREDAIEFVSE
jgi:hypothetical protein